MQIHFYLKDETVKILIILQWKCEYLPILKLWRQLSVILMYILAKDMPVVQESFSGRVN